MQTDRQPQPDGLLYRVIVRGRLTERFAASFDGMTIEPGERASALTGPVRDQSHLMGILAQLDALGLELVGAYPSIWRTGTDVEPLTR